jgi:molybdenum cofactor guanylyltransferase
MALAKNQYRMNIEREDITGVVLAGGQGQRMGGVDKGWLTLDGEPLVAHALRRLGPQVGSLLISANRELDRYRALGHEVVSDDASTSFMGPLAGVLAATRVCATPWLVTVPCDSPHLPSDLVAHLVMSLQNSESVACVATVITPNAEGHKPQPVFCLLHQSMEASLAAYLASGRRSMQGWLTQMRALAVPFDDASAFSNLNTVQELEQAASSPKHKDR